LNFRKPHFDLVELTRIGKLVNGAELLVGVEELKKTLGFVRAQVVGHDMNFSARRLAGQRCPLKKMLGGPEHTSRHDIMTAKCRGSQNWPGSRRLLDAEHRFA